MDVRDVKTLHLSVQGEENEVDGYGAGGPTWMPSKIGGGAAIHRKQEPDLFFTVLCTHTAFLCLWSAAGSVVLQLITAEWRKFKVSTSYKIAGRNITHRRRYKWSSSCGLKIRSILNTHHITGEPRFVKSFLIKNDFPKSGDQKGTIHHHANCG